MNGWRWFVEFEAGGVAYAQRSRVYACRGDALLWRQA